MPYFSGPARKVFKIDIRVAVPRLSGGSLQKVLLCALLPEMTFRFLLSLGLTAASGGMLHAQATHTPERDRVGFAKLAAELGSRMPDGSSVTACLVEGGGASAPGSVELVFPGKKLGFPAGITTFTDHAVSVGKLFFGEYSLSPGIREVDVFTAGTWGEGSILKRGTHSEPAEQRCDIESHSWVHISDGPEMDADTLRRIDYVAQRDNVLIVTTLANERISVFPGIPGAAYNVLTVGVSNGEHSRGGTPVEGVGRLKPDMVVPVQATSGSAPITASTGALLLDAARRNPAWNGAEQAIVLKALLMAGAVKSPFPGWKRSPDKPLDPVYGTGELSAYRSYQILAGGRQSGGKSEVAPAAGWCYSVSKKPSELVFFDVPDGPAPGLSAVLVWNREISNGMTGGGWGNPKAFLPRMELRLYKATGFSPGSMVEESISKIDNVQHLHRRSLSPGRYVMEVTNESPGSPWALAWRSDGI